MARHRTESAHRRAPRPAVGAGLVGLVVGLVAVLGVLGVACDRDDAAPASSPARVSAAGATTTTVATRQAEFCTAMLALADRLDDATGTDAVDDVIETYGALVPIAPLAISDELDAVLDRVERERAGEQLDDDELAVADEAASRVAAWVDLNCRGVANNPGPPPTAPP
jgi:hypothetical protein